MKSEGARLIDVRARALLDELARAMGQPSSGPWLMIRNWLPESRRTREMRQAIWTLARHQAARDLEGEDAVLELARLGIVRTQAAPSEREIDERQDHLAKRISEISEIPVEEMVDDLMAGRILQAVAWRDLWRDRIEAKRIERASRNS